MPDVSARLGLPRILPSQAQKHVTHNESLEMLDAVVQMTVEALEAETPPGAPAAGQCWVLGAAPTGDWAGQAGQIARWDGTGWHFLAPVAGSRAWDVASGELVVFDGSAWAGITGDLQNLPGVGIGTASDATNLLAVAGDATLLSHGGASHQLKVNKASGPDTASLLFQSNWTGHAEMGLAGDTDFSIKVSDDGSAWTTALVFDGATGAASGAAVQTDAADTAPAKLAIVGATYGPASLIGPVSQTGGLPTGAVIEQGQNANGSYVRWADGTQICWLDNFTLSANAETVVQEWWTYPAAFAAAPAITFSVGLVNADWVGLARTQVSAWGPIIAPGTTSAKLAIYPVAGTGTVTATVSGTSPMAIGRWY